MIANGLSLRKHQQEALAWLEGRKIAGLVHEMGLGKTVVAVMDADRLVAAGKVKRILYLAPLSTLENVRRECVRWTEHLSPQIVYGERKKRLDLLDNPGTTNMDILNYDGVRLVADRLMAKRYDMVICDESSRIAYYQTQLTKIVKMVSAGATYKRIMNGLPFSESIENAWSQIDFLDWRIFPGGYYAFRNRYCVVETIQVSKRDKDGRIVWQSVPDGRGNLIIRRDPNGKPIPVVEREFTKITGAKNLDDFEAKVGPHLHRVAAKDAIDLPPMTTMIRRVRMLAEQRKLYRQLEQSLAVELDGQVIDPASFLARSTKLRQVAAGFLYDGERLAHYVPTSKYDELKEFLSDSVTKDQKLVIFTAYKAEPEMVKTAVESIGIAGFILPEDGTKRQAEIDRWEAHPGKAAFICNVDSGGTGLNLMRANLAIFITNGYKLGSRRQAEKRIERIGSEMHDRLTIVDFITDQSIEEDVYDALQGKGELVDLFLERLRQRTLKTRRPLPGADVPAEAAE